MKTALLLIGVACGFGLPALAVDAPPRGNLLELHSCELYAGGCIVSSQATLEGRYMVRAWNFTGGEFAGAPFAGLRLAVLQSSSDNLAATQANPGQAVVYLPAETTPVQHQALMAWLKSQQPGLRNSSLQTRIVPLKFGQDEKGYTFTAGNFLEIKSGPIEACETGACGQALWYTPRSAVSLFTVAIDRSSKVIEPLLQLKWIDAGTPSLFLAKFGEPAPAKDLYVTISDLCGSGNRLF
ncbi:MAG TPA: hypothetical protein VG146_21975 [Verrucomicrobiae bacterium]|nr:hypothetical protein [Verrucomicrobiae bacterium]